MAKRFLRKLLTKESVNCDEEAIVFLVECELATVATIASHKKINQSEYKCHLSIAQFGIDYIKNNMLAYCEYMRINIIISSKSKNVEEWAKRYLQ